MPTEAQHLEQRVAAPQSDLNERDQRIDELVAQLAERDTQLSACIAALREAGDYRSVASIEALSASAEPSVPIATQELQLEDSERQRLIAWGRNCGLEEASKVCQRMAHEAYYPPGTRFKHFTPKAQMRLGDILIKAANAIGGLPDGPYERFHAHQGNKTR